MAREGKIRRPPNRRRRRLIGMVLLAAGAVLLTLGAVLYTFTILMGSRYTTTKTPTSM